MKILQLISSGGFYGAESVLVNLSTELERIGHHSVVGVFENSANRNTEVADRAAARGLRVVRIACRGQMDWGAVRQVRRAVEAEGIDLVHTHGYKADFYALLSRRRTAIPMLATCHNWPGRSWLMRAYGRLDRYLLRYFDGVAAVSKSVADQLVKAGVRKDLRLIPNGVALVPVEGVPDRVGEFRRPDRVIVGSVGRLSPEKGIAFLIEAAGKVCVEFANVLFVHVGDGPLRKNLENQVHGLGIDQKFVFAGERKDLAQVYPSFDIFVLPSLTEGMPMALLEAMAAGIPVVATTVGAVPEIIGDSGSTLVAPGDPGALAAGIRGLLLDKARRQEAGVQARIRVENRFSASAMATQYVDLYQHILLRRRTRNEATTFPRSARRDAV
jgi:glycosyltransferase involved in cell wall biosynthesis